MVRSVQKQQASFVSQMLSFLKTSSKSAHNFSVTTHINNLADMAA